MKSKDKPLRILHAVGPGDVVNSFHHWQRDESLASETSIPYSTQYFSFCHDHAIETHVVSCYPRVDRTRAGNFIVENRPKRGSGAVGGITFHLREVAYGLSIVLLGVRYRADIALIDSGTSHWFVFGLFRLFGIKVINNFHNAFWPAGFPPRKFVARLINRLDGVYLRSFGEVSIGVSPECQRQAEHVAGKPLRFFQYHAIYLAAPFAERSVVDFHQRPIRIAFAGRMERNKGVFDILSMAERLDKLLPGQVVFELCGDGDAFEQVSSERRARGLEQCVQLHGRLKRSPLLEVYCRCHLVIVPTTSEFNEAFAMVVAEAVLLGRPVLSNPVVPACEVLAAATVLARTDDVGDYVEKILALMSDAERYQRLCSACENLRGRFFDPGHGIVGALKKAITSVRPDWHQAKVPQIAGSHVQGHGAAESST